MGHHAACRRAIGPVGVAALSLAVALAAGPSALAEEGKWTLRLEPVYVQVYGHDQHVLTVHESDFDATPEVEDNTAVKLDTEGGFAFRGEFQYTKDKWGCGLDAFWFVTAQKSDLRTAAAEGVSGTIDEVVFEIADRSFTSSDPSEVLFHEVLEDTDVEIWTLDLYAIRTLAADADSSLELQLGLRLGDFDNDYFAVAGVQDVGGAALGASSNYGRMTGPLVGFTGHLERGRHHFEGQISQSVMLGSASLIKTTREFDGPVGTPSFVEQETFRTEQDVAIPVSEFRVEWTYRVTQRFALGLNTITSAWWDVPVPPGVVPIEGGDQLLHENTIVFFGVGGTVRLRF